MNKRHFLIAVGILGAIMLMYVGAVRGEDLGHGGDIVYTKPLKAVLFSHKAHTEDIGLQCDWCHESTFEMEALHMQKEADFDMESLCNERYCGTCHNGDISFSTTTQCARCHIGVKGYNELVMQGKIRAEKDDSSEKVFSEGRLPISHKQEEAKIDPMKEMVEKGYFPEKEITLKDAEGSNEAVFSHKNHMEREHLRCTECHPDIFIMKVGKDAYQKGPLTMEQMEQGKYCGSCHNGVKAFSVSSPDHCDKCHQ